MEKMIEEAIRAINAGDKPHAHQLLSRVVKEQPNNVLGWLWLAEVYTHPNNKRDCYARVLQIDPSNPNALASMEALSYQKSLSEIDTSGVQQSGSANEKLYQGRNFIPRNTYQSYPKRSKKKASPIFYLILFLVLALAFAIMYIVLDKKGFFKDKVTSEPTQNSLIMNPEIFSGTPIQDQYLSINTIEPQTPMPEDEIVSTREPVLFEPTRSTPDPNNLVVNGYFLDDFDGWKRSLKDEGGSSKAAIEDSNNSPFNRMLTVSQEGKGYVAFTQTVPVDNLDLEFSCKLYTKTTEGNIPMFSGTGFSIIVLSYLDANNEELGFTRYLNVNEDLFAGTAFLGAPEKISDTNTIHNIKINSDEQLDLYLKIKQEINSNLLGIDINDVRFIQIVIIAGSNDSNAMGILQISDIILKER